MRSLSLYAKALASRFLPEWLFTRLAERHYLRIVRSFFAPEATLVGRLVDRGDHVVDLGANVGWYTRILAEAVGSAGRVYSVEPIPRTFRFLEYSVRALGLRHVTLFNCACSNREGTAVMQVPREAGAENFYQASIVSVEDVDRRLRQVEVRVTALDTLLGSGAVPITFIKCDVEGHEENALLGARGTITRYHPAMFVELSADPDEEGSPAFDLVRWLEQQGYGVYWLRGVELVRRVRGERSVNYVFLGEAHVDRLLRLGTSVERRRTDPARRREGEP
jgi:FkbM family methyltransferase